MGRREVEMWKWRKELETWAGTTGLEFGFRLPSVLPEAVSVYSLQILRLQRKRLSLFPGRRWRVAKA